MKHRIIGLLGAVINNENLGCVALTCSLLTILEEIASEYDYDFEYYVFEMQPNKLQVENIERELQISTGKIRSFQISSLYSFTSFCKHPMKGSLSYFALKKCDLCIDITAGDSFTDIYGQKRFDGTTRIKELIEKERIPLLLGPQTYGPFHDERNKIRAKHVIENALAVMTRDSLSAEYIHSFSDKEVFVCTDLAFVLPYTKKEKEADKINVGVNISSLLISNKTERTQVNFTLKANYDKYVTLLLDALERDERYRVFIIPHVGADGGFQFKNQFPNFEYLQPISTPIEAKSFISGLDIFIGARMHATIAAFSSGVFTIPIGYSRKFLGLYENLNYPFTVDIEHLDENEAYSQTMTYITSASDYFDTLQNSLVKAEREKANMKKRFTEILNQLFDNDRS